LRWLPYEAATHTPKEIGPYIEIMKHSPAQLTDEALLAEVKRLAQCERETVATLIAHLVEVEARNLYCAEGCSSMFKYCTEVLRFSEDAAFTRIHAAHAMRRFPEILADLTSGALHLSAIRFLEPHLTEANCHELLGAARHKSKREVEKLVRERFPLPDVASTIRKLPQRGEPALAPAELTVARGAVEEESAGPVASGASNVAVGCQRALEPARRPNVVAPLAAERYKVQFTASADLHDKLRRAQGLLRHRIPNGDLSQVFELALAALVEKLERQKLAATDRPRASRGVAEGSRAIPAAVKRVVWARDDGRCTFVAKNGRRCSETGFLEFHHVVAFAHGGEATIGNIALRCRSHNQYEGWLEFGPLDLPRVRESPAAWGEVTRESRRAVG
jgi:hypothetical protein